MAHETPKLKAETRQKLGTTYARRLRRDGRLPVVIYGHKEDPAHMSVDHEQMVHHLQHGAHLLQLDGDDGTETCLIKEVQYDYLGTEVIHVDLTRVDLTEEVTVNIPIEVRGEEYCPVLQQEGVLLQQQMAELEVRCIATNIPDVLTLNIGEVTETESIRVAELDLPEGVQTDVDPEEVVLAFAFIQEEEEEEEELEAVEGEPEVITERGEEEQGAAGAGGEEG